MEQRAFGGEYMGKTPIKEWYKRLKNGRSSADRESDTRSGRPSNTIILENTSSWCTTQSKSKKTVNTNFLILLQL